MQADRIDSTYDEYAQFVPCILACLSDKAATLLTSRVEASKALVRRIPLHRLPGSFTASAALTPPRAARRRD